MQILLWSLSALSFPDTYTQLLEKYVDGQGNVQYEQWKNDPLSTKLKKEIRNTPKPEEDTAYWINIYNALTIRVVIEHLPIQSILDINEGKVWSTYPFVFAHGTYTLNDIEHKILRPRKDPRIHAALNCASKGCPPLWNKPFSEKNLDTELNSSMERWLNHNAFTKKNDVISLSKIFSWYAEDFGPNPIEFLKKMRPHEPWPSWEHTSFSEYDWSLNQKP